MTSEPVHDTELHPSMAFRATSPKDPVAVMTARMTASVARLRAQADSLEMAVSRIQPGNSWQDAASVKPSADVTYVGRLAYPMYPRLSDNPSESRIVYSAPTLFCWVPEAGWLYAPPKVEVALTADVSLQLWVPEADLSTQSA